MGPLAPGQAAFYAEKRFREGVGLSSREQAAFGAYCYHILAAQGSGEFALPHLLAPGAYAREPLMDAFSALKVPVDFIYGETDWMRWQSGDQAARVARDLAGVPASVVRIPGAGHYAMIDQPARFHDAVMRALRGLAGEGEDAAPAERAGA
jgi:pimeloyl-ACP methyl ester carboxylesterase